VALLASGCAFITDAEHAARTDADGDGITWLEDCDDSTAADCATSVTTPTTVTTTTPADLDGDGHPATGTDADCDDTDPAVYPGAEELCDGVDNDCDGDTDEDATDAGVWYGDDDGDGFGSAEETTRACAEPSGYTADDTDCDDSSSEINPDAVESCNELDDDCDGETDEDDAEGVSTFYLDADSDGYGSAEFSYEACVAPTGYVVDETDCDDDSAAVNPGSSELCNGFDDDCDGEIDESSAFDALTWYADADGDSYGAATDTAQACEAPKGYTADSSDCDDTDASIHPGGDERCGGGDEDCDGVTDESDAVDVLTWIEDADGDGWGADGGSTMESCTQPSGAALVEGDCDDTDPLINPDAVEIWYDGTDADCDARSDYDADGDAWASSEYVAEVGAEGLLRAGDCDDTVSTTNPDAVEIWYDGTDADCDDGSDYDADGDGSDHEARGGDDCLEGTALDGDPNPAGIDPAQVYPGAFDQWYDGTDADCDDWSDNDADEDGYNHESAWGVDCYEGTARDSDENPAALDAAEINPGASEIWYDGTDADCDDGSDYDADRDGSDSDSYGGEDCDDADASLPPGCPIDLADADLSLVGDGLGVALAGVGDVSGDGLDDLLLGAATSDAAGTVAGAIYLVSGVSSVGSLADAVALFVGEADGDGAGVAVAGAGDADGDGLEDLLIGADGADSSRGRAYLILGGGLSGTMSLADADHALSGAVTGDLAGAALSGAGDVDGDGLDDLLVGAEGAALGSGTAYVVLGSSLSGAMSLSAADHTLVGNASDEAGAAVASAGDVDGDGLDDLLVGAPGNSLFVAGAGKVDLVLGASLAGSMFLTSADHSFSGEAVGDAVGGVLSPAGDVDDDGLADLLIGAPLSDDGGADAGKAAVILGVSLSGAVSLSAADHTLIGEATGDGAGSAVASVGDVDGDGTPDLLIGAPGADQGGTGAGDAGKIYLISGSALGGSASLADASVSFLGAADDELAGTSVTTAGDIDADGSADIAVGAEGSGTAYLLLGPW